MGEIRSFEDLVAWQKAYQLGLTIYRLTRAFPAAERYGLTQQLRRGAIAIASDVAEGYGRGSRQDYIRFLRIARGALNELDTQLRFAVDLQFLESTDYDEGKAQIDECGRVLAGLLRSLTN